MSDRSEQRQKELSLSVSSSISMPSSHSLALFLSFSLLSPISNKVSYKTSAVCLRTVRRVRRSYASSTIPEEPNEHLLPVQHVVARVVPV